MKSGTCKSLVVVMIISIFSVMVSACSFANPFVQHEKSPDAPIKLISKTFSEISKIEMVNPSANTEEYEVIHEKDGTIRDPAIDSEFGTITIHYKAVLFGGKGNFWAGKFMNNKIKFTPHNTAIIETKINPNRLMYIDLLIKYDGSKSAVDGDFSKKSFEKWVRIEKVEPSGGSRVSYKLRGLLPEGGYENFLWLQSYDEI